MEAFSISFDVKDNSKTAPKWSLDGDLDGQRTLEDFLLFTKQALLRIAETTLKEEQDKGFDKMPRVRVDNVFGKPEREVNPLGKIEYFSRLNFTETIIAMYDEILRRSPVNTGLFERSNYVFRNSRLVATSRPALIAWLAENGGRLTEKDVIRFVNVTPYAARLEYGGYSKGVRGRNNGKTNRSRRRSKLKTGRLISKPNGAYALAHRVIRTKFKQAASFIKFGFIPNGFQGIRIDGGGVFRTSYHPWNNRYSGPYVYPAITFSLSPQGTRPGGLVQ